MFEQACNERIQQFDDVDSDEDIWEEKELTFSDTTDKSPNPARWEPYTKTVEPVGCNVVVDRS